MAPAVVIQMSSPRRGHMFERPAQVPQPVRLADDVRVQRDPHHQRRAAPARASRRGCRRSSARSPSRRSGARRSPGCRSAPAGKGPTKAATRRFGRAADRLVVVAPVERVAVAGLREQVGRAAALRDPGREPARRRRRSALADAGRPEQRALVPLVQPPWRSVFVWPWPTISSPRCGRRRRAPGVVVERGVDERRRRRPSPSNSSSSRQAPTRLPYSRQA